MNIFVTDACPKRCAVVLDDLRLRKMVLETAQLLSTTVRYHCEDSLPLGTVLYSKTHIGHPCSVWARTSRDNFLWLVEHGKALATEFNLRTQKIHASQAVIDKAATYAGVIPDGAQTDFVYVGPCLSPLKLVAVNYRLLLLYKWRSQLHSKKLGNRVTWTGRRADLLCPPTGSLVELTWGNIVCW